MRLLLVDEEIIAGGVDTLRRRLLPELSRFVDSIVWVLPRHVAGTFRDVEKSCENVLIEPMHALEGLARIKAAVARRIAGEIPRVLIDDHLRLLARRHRCNVCMTTCVFSQEIPSVELPVAGWVADINPALPERILANIGMWVERTAATFAISDFICSELKRHKPEYSNQIHSIPLAGFGKAQINGAFMRDHFYYPAAPNEHKGHLPLLHAARGLASRGVDFRLTLTGPGMGALTPENDVLRRMRAYIAEYRQLLEGRVTIAGDAQPSEVTRLFSEASCIVLPSSYEGFGLPLAEALGYGKQVICSDIPPFRSRLPGMVAKQWQPSSLLETRPRLRTRWLTISRATAVPPTPLKN